MVAFCSSGVASFASPRMRSWPTVSRISVDGVDVDIAIFVCSRGKHCELFELTLVAGRQIAVAFSHGESGLPTPS